MLQLRRASLALFVLLISPPVFAQETESEEQLALALQVLSLDWQQGPSVGRIGQQATITVPADYQFLGPVGTRQFMVLNGNLPGGDDYTFGPTDYSWFSVFTFDPSGYVRDDETIDPDALLKVLKDSNKRVNEKRRGSNLPPLYLEGWFVEPHYDLKTRRLEWGTRLRDKDGEITVNYNIRLLGRSGVMSAILVSDPQALSNDLETFKAQLAGYDFISGQRYSEFRQGDKVAQYGITALIVGGAAAAVAKSGAGKALFKFLLIGAIGIFAAAWAFFKSLFGRH